MQPQQAKDIQTPNEATNFAIDWQKWQATQNFSYGDLAEWTSVFEKLATKYNLEEEFRTNGII